MKVCVLASGSSGNSTFIKSGNTSLLIDCGISVRAIEKGLKDIGEGAESLSGILVTHEHIDHVGGLKKLCEKYALPVYVYRSGAQAVLRKTGINCDLVNAYDKSPVIGDIKADFIKLSHDSECCVGYRVDDGKHRVCTLTDTGYLTEECYDFVSGCALALLESNHDKDMLLQGPYPPMLKRRILGERGHLSNEQAAEMIARLPDLNVGEVWLGHISEKNNTEELVFSVGIRALNERGIKEGRDIVVKTIVQRARSEYKNVG